VVVFVVKGSWIAKSIVQSLSRSRQVNAGESQRSQPLKFGLVERIAEDAFALKQAREMGRDANSVTELWGHSRNHVILEQFGNDVEQFNSVRRELHVGGPCFGSR